MNFSAGLKLLSWLHRPLVRTTIIPNNPANDLPIEQDKPVVYVFNHKSNTDLLALARRCKQLELPSPFEPIVLEGKSYSRVVFIHEGSDSNLTTSPTFLSHFKTLLELHKRLPEVDVQIVPVSSFWGRTPENNKDSFFSAIFDSRYPSKIRKLFLIAFLGRRNFIQLSKPVSLRFMADEHGTDERIAQKLARVARVHFRRQHRVLNGPPLPKRKALVDFLMASESVKKAIADEASAKKISQQKAQEKAHEYLNEIAADYSDRMVRIADHVLTWLWNKLYQGITLKGTERVRKLSHDGHEIVYLPCHRSHMDYLLLSYLLYYHGMVPPHIAAGINLNFWPAGPIFRRGGAFFIRRSFAGNKLYTAVFKAYLDLLFQRGYSVEYFTEGGRSRTGRLLAPKTGMLAMTVQSMLRGVDRPITIVPVYLGYDHVMEVATYHKELRGKKKEKESIWQVFGAIKKLKNFGKLNVNFGEPINMQQFFNEQVPTWREDTAHDPEQKPTWLTPTVNNLAHDVMCHINNAAAITAVSLSGLTLLASKQNALPHKRLVKQVDFYLSLLKQVEYSQFSSLPTESASELVEQALKLEKLSLTQDELGDIVSLEGSNAITMSYYRNNIMHMLIVPAIMAALIRRARSCSKQQLIDNTMAFYPLLNAELFVKQSNPQAYIASLIDAMAKEEAIFVEDDQVRLNEANKESIALLSNVASETLQRFGILFSVLHDDPTRSRSEIERVSSQLAKRLGALNGISAPEFFDKKLYGNLSIKLKELGYFAEGDTHINQLYQLLSNLLTAEIQSNISQGLEHLKHD